MFLEKKHNTDMMRKGFSIEMYMEGLPHEPYFIVLTLQKQIIIGLMKKWSQYIWSEIQHCWIDLCGHEY